MARKQISLEQLDHWRDKEVVTVISLPWWVNLSAVAVGLCAIGTIIIEVAKVIVHGI